MLIRGEQNIELKTRIKKLKKGLKSLHLLLKDKDILHPRLKDTFELCIGQIANEIVDAENDLEKKERKK